MCKELLSLYEKIYVCVYVCVCPCERETEREGRERDEIIRKNSIFLSFG